MKLLLTINILLSIILMILGTLLFIYLEMRFGLLRADSAQICEFIGDKIECSKLF